MSIPFTSKRYVLTAELDGKHDSVSEVCDSDTDATFWAIGAVLDRAVDSATWSKGEIVLYSPKGKVLRTMDAKV